MSRESDIQPQRSKVSKKQQAAALAAVLSAAVGCAPKEAKFNTAIVDDKSKGQFSSVVVDDSRHSSEQAQSTEEYLVAQLPELAVVDGTVQVLDARTENTFTRPSYVANGDNINTAEQLINEIRTNPLLRKDYESRGINLNQIVVLGKTQYKNLANEVSKLFPNISKAELEKYFGQHGSMTYRNGNEMRMARIQMVDGQTDESKGLFSVDEEYWIIGTKEEGDTKIQYLQGKGDSFEILRKKCVQRRHSVATPPPPTVYVPPTHREDVPPVYVYPTPVVPSIVEVPAVPEVVITVEQVQQVIKNCVNEGIMIDSNLCSTIINLPPQVSVPPEVVRLLPPPVIEQLPPLPVPPAPLPPRPLPPLVPVMPLPPVVPPPLPPLPPLVPIVPPPPLPPLPPPIVPPPVPPVVIPTPYRTPVPTIPVAPTVTTTVPSPTVSRETATPFIPQTPVSSPTVPAITVTTVVQRTATPFIPQTPVIPPTYIPGNPTPTGVPRITPSPIVERTPIVNPPTPFIPQTPVVQPTHIVGRPSPTGVPQRVPSPIVERTVGPNPIIPNNGGASRSEANPQPTAFVPSAPAAQPRSQEVPSQPTSRPAAAPAVQPRTQELQPAAPVVQPTAAPRVDTRPASAPVQQPAPANRAQEVAPPVQSRPTVAAPAAPVQQPRPDTRPAAPAAPVQQPRPQTAPAAPAAPRQPGGVPTPIRRAEVNSNGQIMYIEGEEVTTPSTQEVVGEAPLAQILRNLGNVKDELASRIANLSPIKLN